MVSFSEAVRLSELSSEPRVVTEPAQPYRILHVNRAWCETTGYAEDQLLGNTCRMLQGPETCLRTMKVRVRSA